MLSIILFPKWHAIFYNLCSLITVHTDYMQNSSNSPPYVTLKTYVIFLTLFHVEGHVSLGNPLVLV